MTKLASEFLLVEGLLALRRAGQLAAGLDRRPAGRAIPQHHPGGAGPHGRRTGRQRAGDLERGERRRPGVCRRYPGADGARSASSAPACSRLLLSPSRHSMRRCAPDIRICRSAWKVCALGADWAVTLPPAVCVLRAAGGSMYKRIVRRNGHCPDDGPPGTDGGGRAGTEGGADRAVHLGRVLQLPSGGRFAPAGERKPDQRGPVGGRHQRACHLLEWAWLVRSLFLTGLHRTAKCL